MSLQIIHDKIFEIRGQKIMLDFDLALLYEVETKRLNEQVKRNMDKFPSDFMFRLIINEWEFIRSRSPAGFENKNWSQFATSVNKNRGKTYLPYAFTEHGVTMLASILRSRKAIGMNIAIVRAFIAMRHFSNSHKNLFEQISDLREEMKTRLGNMIPTGGNL